MKLALLLFPSLHYLVVLLGCSCSRAFRVPLWPPERPIDPAITTTPTAAPFAPLERDESSSCFFDGPSPTSFFRGLVCVLGNVWTWTAARARSIPDTFSWLRLPFQPPSAMNPDTTTTTTDETSPNDTEQQPTQAVPTNNNVLSSFFDQILSLMGYEDESDGYREVDRPVPATNSSIRTGVLPLAEDEQPNGADLNNTEATDRQDAQTLESIFNDTRNEPLSAGSAGSLASLGGAAATGAAPGAASAGVSGAPAAGTGVLTVLTSLPSLSGSGASPLVASSSGFPSASGSASSTAGLGASSSPGVSTGLGLAAVGGAGSAVSATPGAIGAAGSGASGQFSQSLGNPWAALFDFLFALFFR